MVDNRFILTYQFKDIVSGYAIQSFERFETEEEMNDFLLLECRFRNI